MLLCIFTLLLNICYAEFSANGPPAMEPLPISNTSISASVLTSAPTSSASGTEFPFESYYQSISRTITWTRELMSGFDVFRAPECSGNSSAWDAVYATDIIIRTRNNPWQSEGYWSTAMPFWNVPVTLTENSMTKNPFPCCGQCQLRWNGVKVFYWPQADAVTTCTSDYGPEADRIHSEMLHLNDPHYDDKGVSYKKRDLENESPITSAQYSMFQIPEMMKRDDGTFNGTLVENGHTFISPTVYFEMPLFVAADTCGRIGDASETVSTSYLPAEIFSVEPNNVGCWGHYLINALFLEVDPPPQCTFTTKSFNFADLPCPPQSLREKYNSEFFYNPEISYAPILAPPPDLINHDPRWSDCVAMNGWDPYTALRPYSDMPTPTTRGEEQPPSTSAAPAPTHSSPPQPTEEHATIPTPSAPSVLHPEPSQLEPPQDEPPRPLPPPDTPPQDAPPQDAPPQDAPPQGGPPGPDTPDSPPPTEPGVPNENAPETDTGSDDDNTGPGFPPNVGFESDDDDGDQPPPLVSNDDLGDDTEEQPPPVGTNDGIENGSGEENPPPPPIAVGSATVSFAPNHMPVIAGSTIGIGSAVTVDGTEVSVAPEGNVIVDSSTVASVVHLSEPGAGPAPTVLSPGSTITRDGIEIAPVESGVVLNGETLANGEVTTINGQAVSLGADGQLVVGSETIPVDSSAPEPTELVVGGQTLEPGEVATIDGTTISLQSDGDVVVGGTQTVDLDAAESTGIGALIYSAMGGDVEGSSGASPTGSGEDEVQGGTETDGSTLDGDRSQGGATGNPTGTGGEDMIAIGDAGRSKISMLSMHSYAILMLGLVGVFA